LLSEIYIKKTISIFIIFIFLIEISVLPSISTASMLDDAKETAVDSLNTMNNGQAEADALGNTILNDYSIDKLKETLQSKCIKQNPDGSCSEYLVDDAHGISELVPNYNTAIENSSSVSATYKNGLSSAQTQGQATDAFSEFYQYTVNSTQNCSQFGGWKCDITGNYYVSPSVCNSNCSNIVFNCDTSKTPYQCPYSGGVCSGDPPTCTVTGNCIDETKNVEMCRQIPDMRSDPIFGKGSTSEQILANAYLDCTKEITPVYSDPGHEETCDADAGDNEKTEEQGPCTVQNTARVVTENINTPCEKTVTQSEDGQIYLTCENHYSWYKVFDQHVQSSSCPQSCNSFSGGYCTPPSTYQNSSAPDGSTYLGFNYYNFTSGCSYSFDTWFLDTTTNTYYRNYIGTATYTSPCPTSCTDFSPAFCDTPQNYSTFAPPADSTLVGIEYADFVQAVPNCKYGIYSWYKDSNDNYYRNYCGSVSYTLSGCPTACEQIPDGLCSGFPSEYSTPAHAPEGAEYLGRTYENFSACSYDVYKWYRMFDYAVREKIIFDRTSNCIKDRLDEWINQCSVKDYWICNQDGSGCVQIVANQELTGNINKICIDVAGTLKNYHICPNDGGANYTDIPEEEDEEEDEETLIEAEVPLHLDDGTGEKEINTVARYVDQYGFANTELWQTIYGGPGVRKKLNDWYAKVIFECQDHLEVSSSCKSLIDKGCVYKGFVCIDPPQSNPPTAPVEDCLKYRYTYECGMTGKIIGYNVDYYCGSSVYHTYYDANQDFMAFATGLEILHQMQMDTDSIDPSKIRIFPGKYMECQVWPKNCCKELSGGISIADYVKLGYDIYNAYTIASASTGVGMTVYNTAVQLGTVLGGLTPTVDILFSSTGGIFPETMSGVCQYGGGSFTEEIFQMSLDTTKTLMMPNVTLQALATIMQAISIAMLIYSIANIVYNLLFSCTEDDAKTGVMLGQARCIFRGKRCAKEVLGVCIKEKNKYCCYNSLLARIIHKQGEKQLGKTFKKCRGFTPEEFASLDFSQIDLTEYMQYLKGKYKDQYTESEQTTMQDNILQNYPNIQQLINNRFNQYYKPP